MALTALITRQTTSSTKTQGCGMVSLHARGSTVADGYRPCEHRIVWTLTSYPAGFEMTTTDPRRGALNGQEINARDGDWEGWSYAVPCSHAGSYTASMTIYSPDGTSSTDTESWTVAAQSGFTDIYVDSNAGGSNDGTSAANAYSDIQSALEEASTEGSDVNIYVAKGHSEIAAATGVCSCDNLRITTYGSGALPLYDLQTANLLWNLTGENITAEDQSVTNTTTADASTVFVSTGVAVDIMFKNVIIDSGSETFSDYIANSTDVNAGVNHIRWMVWDGNSEVGCDRYSAVFGTFQELNIFGGSYGPTTTERPNRWNENWGGEECHATAVGMGVTTGHKDCWRIHEGSYFSFHRCYGNSTSGASTVCVLGLNDGTPEHITFNECDIHASSTGTSVFCLRSDMGVGVPDGGEDICIRSCLLENEGTSGSSQVIQFNDGVLQRAFFIGNTMITSVSTVNNALMIVNTVIASASKTENNILKYNGATTTNRLINNNDLSSFTDNDLDVGNCTDSTPYRIDSSDYDTDGVNALGFASGNADKAHTLDENYLPTSPSTATITDGMYTDYYGNENTIGNVSGYRGSVVEVPVITIDEPNDPARSLSTDPPRSQRSPAFKVAGSRKATAIRNDSVTESMATTSPIQSGSAITFDDVGEDYEIRYTTNNRMPTSKSKLYTGPITLTRNLTGSDNTVIKARIYHKRNPGIHSRTTKVTVNVIP